MKKFNYSLFVLLFIFSSSVYAQSFDIKEGRWSWRINMDMMGQTQSFNYSHCISKKDLIPQQQKRGESCNIVDSRYSNNLVTWKVICQSAVGQSISTGKIRYTETTANGNIDMSVSGMNIKSKISGEYIGSCN